MGNHSQSLAIYGTILRISVPYTIEQVSVMTNTSYKNTDPSAGRPLSIFKQAQCIRLKLDLPWDVDTIGHLICNIPSWAYGSYGICRVTLIWRLKQKAWRCQCCDSAALQWRHNGRDSVSNHQPHGCLLNRLFRRRSKKTSKLCVTGLCAGNSPGTGEFPAQRASNAENVSIWWRHRGSSVTRRWQRDALLCLPHWYMKYACAFIERVRTTSMRNESTWYLDQLICFWRAENETEQIKN